MKKIITAIRAAALLVSLTGCNNETASNGGTSPLIPERTSSESTVTEIETSPTLDELIAGFSLDEIPLPDGTILKKTEAVDETGSADYPILKFGVSVMRYCKPVFQSSFDDPDSFDCVIVTK